MNNYRRLSLIGTLIAVATFVACIPPILPGGFSIQTSTRVSLGDRTYVRNAPDVYVRGTHQFDAPGAGGSIYGFFYYTDSAGYKYVDQGRRPATWNFELRTGPCAGQNFERLVLHSNTLTCNQRRGRHPFFVSPNTIDASNPQATITVVGNPGDFDTSNGMPLVEFYDDAGYCVTQTMAFSVSDDSSTLQAYTPDLSLLPNGSAGVLVNQAMPDGSWDPLGAADVNITGSWDPSNPPPPPDPCLDNPSLCQPDPCLNNQMICQPQV